MMLDGVEIMCYYWGRLRLVGCVSISAAPYNYILVGKNPTRDPLTLAGSGRPAWGFCI